MIRHILIATDGSKLSQSAIAQGVGLAKSIRAKVTGLHVVPLFHRFTYRAQVLLTYRTALTEDSAAAFEATTAECAKKLLSAVDRAAKSAGVSCVTTFVRGDEPYKAIIDTAKKKKCDLIVMASHGHGGLSSALLGSETQKVLVHSEVPVLVTR